MNYYFLGLLIIAAYYTLKTEKSKKRKQIYMGIYASILIISFVYLSGEKIGEAMYYLNSSL